MNSKLKVIKVGGKLIENEDRFSAFLKDFSKLEGNKILVHGGGNLATEIATKLGYETKIIDGRRITDKDSMQVITMVYGGLISKKIVAKLYSLGLNAVGLCGADGGSVISKKRPIKDLDYGFVGDIESVNVNFVDSLLKKDIIPVFSAISCSTNGELYNTNADSIASAIAVNMSAKYETELYYCFEKKGVLANPENEDSIVRTLDFETYEYLVQDKVITDGMLPKLHNCFEALQNGVSSIHLGDFTLLEPGSTHTKII